MEIEQLRDVTDDVVEALRRLVPQLSASAAGPDAVALMQTIAQPGMTVLVARADGDIVGALTLLTFRTPWGMRARIEEVVVDEDARRHGAGSALVRAAIDRSREFGADRVDLTSRPTRAAANEMYQSLGFRRRETNVYRYLV